MLSTDAEDRNGGAYHARFTAVTRWICYFGVAIILLLPVPVLYEVIADQLEQPPIWVFETTGYAIIMIAFTASGYGLSTGHHFKVDLLAQRFPAMAHPLARLSGLLEAAFGLILVVAGLVVLYVAYPHRGEEMPVVPVLGDAMRSAADAIPRLDADEVRASLRR